ncbi:MAG TPA: GNAT family N-acetyltransferase, partial [Thermoanaerobaculia bacterium]
PSVRAIYVDGLATGQASFETKAPAWTEWDASHLPEARLVARDGDTVIGWAALSRVSRRDCYRGVAEVSVYVAANARGKGIGDELMRRLIAESEAAGIWTLQSSVFPENEASVKLHMRHGFRIVGKREKIAQHHGVWRDTVILERRSSIR